MDKQLIDKLIIINIYTILIIIKIISFNVIMNNVFILTITGIGPTNQGSKCEEWKDEKKGSATVLYTQIINSQLVYTVHGTHFAEGSAAP